MRENMDEMLTRVREYVFQTDEALKESQRHTAHGTGQHETAALKQIRWGAEGSCLWGVLLTWTMLVTSRAAPAGRTSGSWRTRSGQLSGQPPQQSRCEQARSWCWVCKEQPEAFWGLKSLLRSTMCSRGLSASQHQHALGQLPRAGTAYWVTQHATPHVPAAETFLLCLLLAAGGAGQPD